MDVVGQPLLQHSLGETNVATGPYAWKATVSVNDRQRAEATNELISGRREPRPARVRDRGSGRYG
jgi:hypothetical protein